MQFTVQGNLLRLDSYSSIDMKQLDRITSGHVEQYRVKHVNRRHKDGAKDWDGKVSYLFWHQDNFYVPAGMWRRLLDLQNAKVPYEVVIHDFMSMFDQTITAEELDEFVETLEVPFAPREDQYAFMSRMLKAKNCCAELATGYGKTYLSYLLARFIRDSKRLATNKKALMIVPTQQLVEQCHDDMVSYQIDYADNEYRYKVYKIYSGARNNISMQDADLVCGTFQSLVNYPEDFFYQFDIVIGDEAHKAAAESIKQILMNCHKASYRFGITGSMPGETTLERLTIESYIGAYIGQMTAMDLVDLGILPEFVIKQMVIQHSDELDAPYIQYIHNNPHVAFDSTRLLAAEQHHIMHCLPGNDLIAQVVINLDMNTLVLCKRRDHIDEIANILNAYITKTNSTKQVHVIKGGVSMDERKHIKSLVEADPYNHIIVATIGTMAMGVSINALFYAFLIMYGHSEFNTLQGVGRLLRKHPEKNVATIIDTAHKLATNCIPNNKKMLASYSKSCYDIKHQQSRIALFKSRKYPVDDNVVTFNI